LSTRNWTPEQLILLETGPDGQLALKRVAVSADAGSGKTSVLVERVNRLPAGARALCVSFTEKSKTDLERRLADRLEAEVYTIHGFCGRVTAEFGSTIGLPPIFRIIDQDERDELFQRSFESVYRRSPPANVRHGAPAFHRLCEAAAELGAAARIRDFGDAGGDCTRFVREVIAQFEQAKRTARVIEYSDLERFAAELLERSEVALALRNRYAQVFVDEFQDTNPVQCRIVSALTGQGSLFVVGDKKQSIYGFRGADVRVFERFVAGLPERRRLSSNFRSHADVIAAVNAVSAGVIAGYEPMKATGGRGRLPGEVFSALPRVARVHCDSDAEGIVSIVRGLGARGVAPADVVVLLRRVRGNEALLDALRGAGVGVAVSSSSNASGNEALMKLLNLWIWACEPWQRLRAARVLADFGRAPRAELRERLESLRAEHEAAGRGTGTCEELLVALDRRFGLKGAFGAVFEQFRVFVLAHQAQGLSPGLLARRLHRLLSNEEDVGGFVLLPPPANLGDSIRVLTVHGSKGLEFPVVILADVGPRRRRSDPFLKVDGEVWLPDRNEKGELDWSPDELQAARAAQEARELEESARLLYVAMTRAEEALYVLERRENPEAKAKKPVASWAEWLKAGIGTVVEAKVFGSASTAPVTDEVASTVPPAQPLDPDPPEYRPARRGVSALVREQEPAPARGGGRGVTYSSSASAAEVGTELHEQLENEDWEGLTAAAERHGVDLGPFRQWRRSSEGERVFNPAGARVFPEFAFEMRYQESVVAGRIDRLIVFEGGEAWIIDYKVSRARMPSEELVARYAPQLAIYREAVKKLTKAEVVRAFLVDVAAATGKVWHEVIC
jgi:ATP-dependent exoDNAse (exonuclease V) beta subunit